MARRPARPEDLPSRPRFTISFADEAPYAPTRPAPGGPGKRRGNSAVGHAVYRSAEERSTRRQKHSLCLVCHDQSWRVEGAKCDECGLPYAEEKVEKIDPTSGLGGWANFARHEIG